MGFSGLSRMDLKEPPTAVGGIVRQDLEMGFSGLSRMDLKEPPTAVGGIVRFFRRS